MRESTFRQAEQSVKNLFFFQVLHNERQSSLGKRQQRGTILGRRVRPFYLPTSQQPIQGVQS